MTGDTPYPVLGVAPDATVDSIRDSYRRLARIHHPDAPTGSAEEMTRLNEAWRVLVDPARRAMYDATLRGGTVRAAAPTEDRLQRETYAVAPRTTEPPKFPWRWMAIGVVVGAIAIITMSKVFAKTPLAPIVDQVIEPGSCIRLEPNGDAAEASCSGPNDGVVVAFVPFEQTCAPGLTQRRDRQGRGWVCLAP
jgi:curved DNA-binding protein CbpA